jgi:hypothetical protein
MKTIYLLGIALALMPAAGAQSKGNSNYNQNSYFWTTQKPAYGNANWSYQTRTTQKGKPDTYSWSTGPGKGVTSYTWTAPGVYEDVTVKRLEFENVDAREALRALFRGVKRDYDIVDKELPDRKISLKADNIKLTTALDLITQSAGLKWRADKQKDKTVYKIGKEIAASPHLSLDFTNATTILTDPATGRIRATYPNSLTTLDPNANKILYDTLTTQNPTVLMPGSTDLTSAGLYTANTLEERSTFICPHCKGQATVIRHRQIPKCPKCSREFLSDWQFCPFDGSKRPATASAWRFCPICGKEVEPEEPKRKSSLFDGASRISANLLMPDSGVRRLLTPKQ